MLLSQPPLMMPPSRPPPAAAERASAPTTPRLEFRVVYQEHFRYVWRSLRRLGLEEHACADAAQQVFLVVHQRLPEFRGDAKMTTWLFAICANVVSNARRTYARRRETTFDEAHASSTSAAHARTDARLTLERLLEGMPVEQRTALLLLEVEELTCVEIAAVTGTSVGTVKSRLRLARERLAAKLGVKPAEKGTFDE